MSSEPIIYWMRRDFRLADNPALAACKGRPIVPVVIRDSEVNAMGAAPAFRFGRAVEEFYKTLGPQGGTVILRTGDALAVLEALIAETGATKVVWNRLYDPKARARDSRIKAALKDRGIAVDSFNAHLLFEPWTVQTGTGGFYRVYTPFWRAVRDRDVPAPLPGPKLTFPAHWPDSDALTDWALAAPMNRGAEIVEKHLLSGEKPAQDRLAEFVDRRLARYRDERDFLDLEATSGLSEPLAYGEISPRQCWHAGWQAMKGAADKGAEHFLKELVWREFAYHLMFHSPEILSGNWRPEWDGFPWAGEGAAAERWRYGETGVEIVDAAMRELYVTGRMHNRARMLVASYLTKHLMVDWRIGRDWFAETLVDWDPASNAMGWQWVAGSGPDAAPFFRIFNPDTQAEKFDRKAVYRTHWLHGAGARDFAAAIPMSRTIRDAPRPMVSLPEGRERALSAYKALKS
jgi:deoxyribodipyrimidine photo-lyase